MLKWSNICKITCMKKNRKFLFKISKKLKFQKSFLSKYSCHGNIKFLGQRNVMHVPNWCQIKKSHLFWLWLQFTWIIEKLLMFEVSMPDISCSLSSFPHVEQGLLFEVLKGEVLLPTKWPIRMVLNSGFCSTKQL